MTKVNLDNITIQLEAQLGEGIDNIEDIAKSISGFDDVWVEDNKIYATKGMSNFFEYHRFVDGIKTAKEHLYYQIDHAIK